MAQPLLLVLFLLAIPAAAVLLVRVPRGLIGEASGAAPTRRLEGGLMIGLAALGLALYAALALVAGQGEPLPRLGVALGVMVLAAVAYIDLRFLVIPDLCSLALAVLALAPPLALPLSEALFGAALCGGLLWGVAFAFKRLAGVDGMGFGDVKLAAALGGLLGMQHGLWTITMAALGAAFGGVAMARMRPQPEKEGPALIPYGAALAAVGAGWLIWSRR